MGIESLKVGFIGAGNMGGALAKAAAKSEKLSFTTFTTDNIRRKSNSINKSRAKKFPKAVPTDYLQSF